MPCRIVDGKVVAKLKILNQPIELPDLGMRPVKLGDGMKVGSKFAGRYFKGLHALDNSLSLAPLSSC